MTKRRPTNNLPQPNSQPPETSPQSPESPPQPLETSSGSALSRPSPVILEQSLSLADAGTGIHTVDPEREEMGGNGREIQKSSLTFRQQAALTVIAATPTVAQAARQSGIGESTLYRWLEDDKFRAELIRLREESANLTRQELQGLMLRSVSVIAEAMDDPDKAIRLRAARYAMSFAARIGEVEKMRQEIRDIESALPTWTGRNTVK